MASWKGLSAGAEALSEEISGKYVAPLFSISQTFELVMLPEVKYVSAPLESGSGAGWKSDFFIWQFITLFFAKKMGCGPDRTSFETMSELIPLPKGDDREQQQSNQDNCKKSGSIHIRRLFCVNSTELM